MIQSELCERSLLNTPGNKRVESSYRSRSEIQKVNVLNSLPDVNHRDHHHDHHDDGGGVSTAASVTCCSATTPTTVSYSTSNTTLVTLHESLNQQQSNNSNVTSSPRVDNSPSKVRKRRFTVPSPTNSTSASPSLSSLLSTAPSRLQSFKSPLKESGAVTHITNGANAKTPQQIQHSNLTKTVTFSLAQPHNVNLVRFAPVSLRPTFEQQSKIAVTEKEVKNLKELLLLHLDLVQQQQNIIVEKDKQIAELKTESSRVSQSVLSELVFSIQH